MTNYLVLIFFTTAASFFIIRKKEKDVLVSYRLADPLSVILFLAIFAAFWFFSGLRTKYNDTSSYTHAFNILKIENISFSTVLNESYGGFDYLQKLVKTTIGNNSQYFLLTTSLITTLSNLVFIKKHSDYLPESIFLYSITSFSFGMAGIKQAIAIAIALWAIDAYLNQKYILSALILLAAITFHPFVICLICIPFLTDRFFGKKIVLVILAAVIAFFNLDAILPIIYNLLGKVYTIEEMTGYTINPMRVVVTAIPVILSVKALDEINRSKDKLLILGVNMQIIGFIFIAMGLFVNPIYVGRMATYFTALTIVTTPKMIHLCFKKSSNGTLLIIAYYCFEFAYFLLDMLKLGSISFFTDQFAQASFWSLF